MTPEFPSVTIECLSPVSLPLPSSGSQGTPEFSGALCRLCDVTDPFSVYPWDVQGQTAVPLGTFWITTFLTKSK